MIVVVKSANTISPGIFTVLPKYCLSIGVNVIPGNADTLQYNLTSDNESLTSPGAAVIVKSNKLGRAPPYVRADLNDDRVSMEQFEVFKCLVDKFKVPASMANSAALLNLPGTHFDFVRLGLAIYGISPITISTSTYRDFGLKPVMRLKSRVIAIRRLPKGEAVSYGGTWINEKETNIGVVALGYADGYPRNIPADTPVWINGRIVYIVGSVCMDMIIIDLGINSTDCIGNDVIFWGPAKPRHGNVSIS